MCARDAGARRSVFREEALRERRPGDKGQALLVTAGEDVLGPSLRKAETVLDADDFRR